MTNIKKKENIGLVFDSRYKIGGGHFWRCFNFAKILKNKERNFFFISNDLNKVFINLIYKEKFFYLKNKNLNNLNDLLIKNKIDILILDYYYLNEETKIELQRKFKVVIVIDDHVNKKHHSQIFINNNFLLNKTKRNIQKLNPKTELLLGHKYFINQTSINNNKKIKTRTKKIKNIFVFFGTSDETNETMKFIKAAKSFDGFNFFILVGKMNRKINEIKKVTKKFENFKIYYNLTNNETLKLCKNKDLSFGSGGINLSERLFLGVPSVAICTADNQLMSLNNLKKKKIIFYLGENKSVKKENIKQFLNKISEDSKFIFRIKNNMKKYYGNGYNPKYLKNKVNNIIKKFS